MQLETHNWVFRASLLQMAPAVRRQPSVPQTEALTQISLPVQQFSPVSVAPPLLHTHTLNRRRSCTLFDVWPIQRMPAGDLAHPGLSPGRFSYKHVVTHTVLYVRIVCFLNHETAPWCIGLCLYPNGLPKDPVVVRWSAWGRSLVRSKALE
jgi:hypothetical protein